MAKNTRKARHNKARNPNTFRIIDFGICTDPFCPEYRHDDWHRHGIAYSIGKPTTDALKAVSESLLAMGYHGEVEVETLSKRDFHNRYGFQS